MNKLLDDEKLEALLTTPSDRLISDLKKIAGDIIILGAAGKMGPSLATLLKKRWFRPD